MSTKIKVGIEIDEILRAKWLQFDRFYVQEFGEDQAPLPDPYCFDLFKTYRWEDTVETVKELKEPEDMPDDINPVHYQIDENGEADADSVIFKKKEEVKLTAKQVFNRFMYEDFVFEIHGSAPMMYKGMDLDVNNFLLKYGDNVEFVLLSVENRFSIPPTLFFLSKITSRFKNIVFVDKPEEMWEHVDVLITTNPEILDAGTPELKKVVRLHRPYNKDCQDGFFGSDAEKILQLNDLNGNEKFEKLINYTPKKEENE